MTTKQNFLFRQLTVKCGGAGYVQYIYMTNTDTRPGNTPSGKEGSATSWLIGSRLAGGKRPHLAELLLTNLKLRFKFFYLRLKLLYISIKARIFYFQCSRSEKVLKPIKRIKAHE